MSFSLTEFNPNHKEFQIDKELRILVVDNDKNQLFLSAMQLVLAAELSCIFAGDGAEAVKALNHKRFTQLTVPLAGITEILLPPLQPFSIVEHFSSPTPSQPIGSSPGTLFNALNLNPQTPLSSPSSSYLTTPSTTPLSTTAPVSTLASPTSNGNLSLGFTLEEIGVEIAAVLMDYHMPMNGLEATRQIRANEATHPDQIRVPIYLYSSGRIIEGKNSKDFDFLDFLKTKGWDLDGIITTKGNPASLMECIPMFKKHLGFVSEEQSSDDESEMDPTYE